MLFNNNIIPIYVNSKDRVDIKKQSTDMTIQLSKSLRNISSINISDVVIPDNELLINNNNSSLSGYILANGETYFSIDITHGNYDITTLGQEVETQLQNNSDFKEFGITWSVSYDTATRRYVIIASYPSGVYLASWGIKFNYSSLVDVLGIGDSETTDKETTTTGAQLTINTQRSPSIQRSLYYNITSSALTNDINTSYLHSLAKGFSITSNNTINTEIKYTTSNSTIINSVINSAISNSAGIDVYISENALNLFVLNDREVVVYSRTAINTQWTESTRFTPTINYDYSLLSKIAVSDNLSTVVVGSHTADSKVGATWVYLKIGYTYIEYAKLVSPDYTSEANQGIAISINNNGTLIAIGGTNDDSKGAIWIWKLIGTVWTQIQNIKGTITDGRFGRHVSMDISGSILAVSEHNYNTGRGRVFVYTTADEWTTYSQQILTEIGLAVDSFYGFSTSLSRDGKTIAVGAYGFSTDIGRVYVYRSLSTPFDTKYTLVPDSPIGTSRFGYSLNISKEGKYLVVGGYRDDTNIGAIWRINLPFSTQEKIVYTDTSPTITQFGFSVSISKDGAIVAGRPLSFYRRGDIITLDVGRPASLLIVSSNTSDPFQGRSISISDDEKIVAVGAPSDNGYVGGTWVYTNNFTTQIKILGTDSYHLLPQQGYSVSLSGNGLYLAISGPKNGTANGFGTVWVFKSIDNWVTVSQLIYINNIVSSSYGEAVELNYDGTVLIVGAKFTGYSYLYTTTNDWSTIPVPVIKSNTATSYGISVSINSTGDIYAVGNPDYNFLIGRVHVYVKSGLGYIERYVVGTNNISTQGSSVALNGVGNVLVFGGIDFNGGVGAAWVATTSNNWFTYNVVQLDIKNNIGNANIGVNVSINVAGNIISVGGDLDNNTGSIWKCTTTNNWITHTVLKLQSTYEINSRLGRGLATTDNYIIAGAPGYKGGFGRVIYWYSGYLFSNYTRQIPTKTYTLFELSNKITELLQLSDYYITASYDMVNKVNLVITTNYPEAYFKITSNIGFIEWNTPSHVVSASSEIIDMSINNNILKTVINKPENGLIVDTTSSIIYRKYKPGFTLNETDTIDIQLRNERDVIVDLGGINWVMVIYVTIHF